MRAIKGKSGRYILAQLDKLDMNSSGGWLRDLLVALLFETILDQQVSGKTDLKPPGLTR